VAKVWWENRSKRKRYILHNKNEVLAQMEGGNYENNRQDK